MTSGRKNSVWFITELVRSCPNSGPKEMPCTFDFSLRTKPNVLSPGKKYRLWNSQHLWPRLHSEHQTDEGDTENDTVLVSTLCKGEGSKKLSMCGKYRKTIRERVGIKKMKRDVRNRMVGLLNCADRSIFVSSPGNHTAIQQKLRQFLKKTYNLNYKPR